MAEVVCRGICGSALAARIASISGLMLALFSPAAAHAGVAYYQVTLDQAGPLGFFTSSVAPPTFTADFSIDKKLQVTYSAPVGKQFSFSKPAGETNWGFIADIWDDNALSSPLLVPGFSYVLAGLQGVVDAPSVFAFEYDADGFVAQFRASFASDEVSFTSFTMLLDVPSAFNESYSNATLHRVFFRGFAGLGGSVVALKDIQAVPEPGTLPLAVFTLAVLALLIRRNPRHRHAKRENRESLAATAACPAW